MKKEMIYDKFIPSSNFKIVSVLECNRTTVWNQILAIAISNTDSAHSLFCLSLERLRSRNLTQSKFGISHLRYFVCIKNPCCCVCFPAPHLSSDTGMYITINSKCKKLTVYNIVLEAKSHF